MGWIPPPVSLVIFGSGIVAIVVGVAALRKRPDPMAWPLGLFLFAVAAWALAHAVALAGTTLEHVVFWHQLRYPGTVFAPVFYLIVVLTYAGYEQSLSKRVYAGLSVIPILTILIVWTNPSHGLFWESLSIVTVDDASVLVPVFGPWYWVNLGYLYVVTFVGLVILAETVVRSSRVYRKQAGVMLIGGLVPLVTNAAINFGVGQEPMIDFTTTSLAVTGVTFALALFYLDLLDMRPVARDRLLEELDDGVLVVGPDDRIRDFNPTAARILGDIAINQPVEEIFEQHVAPDGGELVVEIDGRERVFQTGSTTLTDRQDREIGQIIYLNDITKLIEREQRISVLNRVLRHNIRNELNVASGRLEMVDEHQPPEDEEHIAVAADSIQRVIEFAEKARHVERTLQARDRTVEVSVTTIADRVISQARETYSDVDIEYTLSIESEAETPVRVVDEELFEMALWELIENGIEHNDQESPHVTVRIDRVADHTQVSVIDNGPGIPEEEIDILSKRSESSLRHGGGLGLWLVQWTATLSSGELTFEENDPRGSIVTLSVQNTAHDE